MISILSMRSPQAERCTGQGDGSGDCLHAAGNGGSHRRPGCLPHREPCAELERGADTVSPDLELHARRRLRVQAWRAHLHRGASERDAEAGSEGYEDRGSGALHGAVCDDCCIRHPVLSETGRTGVSRHEGSDALCLPGNSDRLRNNVRACAGCAAWAADRKRRGCE